MTDDETSSNGRNRVRVLESYYDDMMRELGHRVNKPYSWKSDQDRERIPKLIVQMNDLRKEIRRLKAQ